VTQPKPIPMMELKRRALDRLHDEALSPYAFRKEMADRLTVGIGPEGDEAYVELYFVGERPSDAIVIGRARLNRFTGEGTVEIDEEAVQGVAMRRGDASPAADGPAGSQGGA
jgi:hypothetical protein